jgi:hypothetical protein
VQDIPAADSSPKRLSISKRVHHTQCTGVLTLQDQRKWHCCGLKKAEWYEEKE